uniref:Uncharacterized protein n=1 Tax=Salix viminalis TaxID=40686 RepID=A0A6N2LJ63_SALVM
MVPERWLLLRVRLYNSFNPCNSVGMVPCKWFEDRSIKCNRVAFPSSGGTYPDKLFSPITSLVSVLMFLIERGIGPESLLLSSKKTDRFLKFPMESGIPPVKTLLDKSSLLRDSSNPISFGMKPESLLPRRKRMDSYIIEHGHVPNRRRDWTRELVLKKFLKFPIEFGIPPVKTLLDKSSLLRDSRNPISFGMKPESLLPRRKRMDRFLKFPMEAGSNHYIIEHGHVPNRRRDGTRELVLKKMRGFHRLKRYLTSQVD